MMKDLFSRSRQRCMMLVSFLVWAVTTFAVPAKPGLKRLLTLTDGTTVNAMLVGDEYAHYWIGDDGKNYQAIADTDVYQEVNGQLIVQKAQQRRVQADKRRMKRLTPRRIGDVGPSITGQKKGLIILVNFSDKTFKSANNNALYQRIANEENFSYGNFKGSMYDYFKAQSEGQFLLTFDVVGPVTVSKSQSYYGSNDSDGNDKHPAEMVIEALQLADQQGVNYADYDWDSDGEVEQVYVIYADKGEADGGATNTIWPHEWTLSAAHSYEDGSGKQTLDGVIIDTYACGSELNGQTGSVAGIGTMCHEFSHCLGYPDFYDTDYSGGQGMFEWDLMDSGSYNGDGYRPAGYTSYERWVAGWKTPIELVNTQDISNMKALQDNGSDAYIIYNKGNNNEYYLLENRQKMKWDTDLPGAGLLILHVDYDASVWSHNTVNDTPSHQRMTWVAADNNYQYTVYQGIKYYTTEGAAKDPFPYGSVNAFGKNTTPAAKLYNKNSDNSYYLDSSVENITQNSDGTISFSFVGVTNVATPTFSPNAGRYTEAQTVTINCETEGAAIHYTLDGTTPTTSSSVYSSALVISETTTVKAIAVKDEEQSAVATAKYTIGASASDPNTKTFKLVTSTDDLEPGMRYIIACGSKATAAGAQSSSYLSKEDVTIADDVVTIGNDVAVFVLEKTDNGWTFQNENSNQYLQSTAAKNVSYSNSEYAWTLSNGTVGVIMTAGSYGTMLYNVSSPRFTTYTSTPTTSMIQANLYMEISNTSRPLLYEGLSGYSSDGDATAELTKDSKNLDYSNWASLSKIYAGGKSNAYSNGGCLKFGSGSAVGSMTTGNISLTDGGTLTFYLKKYGSDTGTLNVTVTGATADVTKFTPQSSWTLCTVKLTKVTGPVTIKLATSSKRAYVDEITLTSSVVNGDANGDGKVTITDAVAIVNYILGNPSEGFNEVAADMNGDGVVSITDAVAVVNIILNSSGVSAPMME